MKTEFRMIYASLFFRRRGSVSADVRVEAVANLRTVMLMVET